MGPEFHIDTDRRWFLSDLGQAIECVFLLWRVHMVQTGVQRTFGKVEISSWQMRSGTRWHFSPARPPGLGVTAMQHSGRSYDRGVCRRRTRSI
jgi:hypothetical protein